MALIEAPRLFQMNHDAQKPSEAFFDPETAVEDARFVRLAENFVQSTVGLGDRLTVFEEGARQLGVKNDNREARLFAAYVREVMCGVIAGIECDLTYRDLDMDHNAPNILDGFCLTEEAKERVMTGARVAFDPSAVALEGDKPTQFLARGYRQVDLESLGEVAAVTYLITLRMVDGKRIDGADRVDEDPLPWEGEPEEDDYLKYIPTFRND